MGWTVAQAGLSFDAEHADALRAELSQGEQPVALSIARHRQTGAPTGRPRCPAGTSAPSPADPARTGTPTSRRTSAPADRLLVRVQRADQRQRRSAASGSPSRAARSDAACGSSTARAARRCASPRTVAYASSRRWTGPLQVAEERLDVPVLARRREREHDLVPPPLAAARAQSALLSIDEPGSLWPPMLCRLRPRGPSDQFYSATAYDWPEIMPKLRRIQGMSNAALSRRRGP